MGAVAGVFAYAANYMVQQIFRVDDPIEAVGVHAGGGVVGLVFAGLYQSPSNVTPQLVDIAVLVSIILVPAYVIFKLMDLCGQVRIFGRKPIRLKSTPNEENLGLTFDDPSSRVGIPVAHFHYLPDDLRRELTDHVNILTSMPAHLARSLYNDASDLIEAIRESIYSDTSNAVEAIKQSVDRKRQTEMQLNRLLDLQEGLRQRIDNIPMVLNRLNTGKGEQVNLESIVEEVLGEYQKRYPEVKIKSSTKGDATPVNGDANLTKEAVRMLLSNSVRACTRRLDRGSRDGDDPYEARVEVSIDWNPADGGEQVLLKIEDNGVGITPEVRRQLGHPLSASSTGRGYGLGLFFANLIAQRFGGTLSCPPQKDSPTTLFVMGFQRWKL